MEFYIELDGFPYCFYNGGSIATGYSAEYPDAKLFDSQLTAAKTAQLIAKSNKAYKGSVNVVQVDDSGAGYVVHTY